MTDLPNKVACIETHMQDMDRKIDALDKKMDKGFDRITQHFDNTIEAFNKSIKEVKVEFELELENKAGKWVEKILWGIGAVVGTSIVLTILSLIFKEIK